MRDLLRILGFVFKRKLLDFENGASAAAFELNQAPKNCNPLRSSWYLLVRVIAASLGYSFDEEISFFGTMAKAAAKVLPLDR
jgi:hypothetical protein